MTVLEEIDQIRGYLSGPGQPFELIEQDVRGAMLPVYRHVPKNLSKIVADAAAFNDRIFMVYGDQRITFAEALAKAAGLAGLLKDRYGLGKKDRVAIAMRNSPDWVIAYLAVLMNGAAAALINSRGAPDEMLFAIHDVECALLTLADFDRLGREHPRIKIQLLQNLCITMSGKLRKANWELGVLTE